MLQLCSKQFPLHFKGTGSHGHVSRKWIIVSSKQKYVQADYQADNGDHNNLQPQVLHIEEVSKYDGGNSTHT